MNTNQFLSIAALGLLVLPTVLEARVGAGRPGGGINRPGGGGGGMNRPSNGGNQNRPGGNHIGNNNNVNVNVNGGDRYHGGYHGGYDNGYHHHHDVWRAVGTAAAVTATVAVTSAVIGSMTYTRPSGCITTIVNGLSYLQCGSSWYQPSYVGSQVQYVVVGVPR